MSTLRVDNIKSRTGSTVTIADSNTLSVTGSLSVSGVTTFSSGAELNLQGVNLNSGTRGDVLVSFKLCLIPERFTYSPVLFLLYIEPKERLSIAASTGEELVGLPDLDILTKP